MEHMENLMWDEESKIGAPAKLEGVLTILISFRFLIYMDCERNTKRLLMLTGVCGNQDEFAGVRMR